MKLNFDQLSQQLNNNIPLVNLIFGEEPLLALEAAEAIRQSAAKQGYAEREVFHVDRSFNWNIVEAACQSMSLFSSKKVIEIRIETASMGKDGSEVMQHVCEHLGEDNIIIITMGKLDGSAQRGKWFKAIEQKGAVIQLRKVPLQQLPGWLTRRAKQKHLSISSASVQFIADCVEGNLLAAAQEIDKLVMQFGTDPVSDQQVYSAIMDNSRFDVFQVSDAALSGDVKKALRALAHVKAENVQATFALWPLHRDIEQLCVVLRAHRRDKIPLNEAFRQNRIWPQRQPVFQQAMKRLSGADLKSLLEQCHQIDRMIKGVNKDDGWLALERLIAGISSGVKFAAA